jgi:LacI family transcriptional regulator
VPGDLSVIGFDDIELAAAIGLTTVRQPLRESGRLGARLLLAALDGDETSVPGESPRGLPALEVVVRRTVSQPVT